MSNYKTLKDKIEKKQAQICIIGLGYVGLPLAVAFGRKGYSVIGLDNSKSRIARLKKGERYIVDVDSKEVLSLIKKGKFSPTTNQKVLKTSDIIIICVPTPLRKVKIPDISYIVAASKTVGKYLKEGQLVILESTSYPTTTREVVLPILKKTKLKEEKDFFLCFSPERVNPGDKKFPLTKIPKIVGGLSNKSNKLAKSLYSKIIKDVFTVSSPEVAESSKLLENTFRLVNIALVNEFTMVAERLGINMWEVVEAAKTKPFGFMPFYPGPGIGGHCLDGKEFIFIKNGCGVEATTIDDFVEKLKNNQSLIRKKLSLSGVEYIKPKSDYKMLTFDTKNNKTVFKPIDMLSKRKAVDSLLRVTTVDNRKITITDKHPLFALSQGKLKIKFAKDLQVGERIPFALETENSHRVLKTINPEIDLIEQLKNYPALIEKIRIRPKSFSWRQIKDKVYQIDFKTKYYTDYIRYNHLPLKYFLQAEEKRIFNIDHKDLYLCTGRGPSQNTIPAVLEINSNFCRLLGYYLSEGCLTKDKSFRVRFSFHRDEREYINDVCTILDGMQIKYSIYNSKVWKSSCIKISSEIFGLLLKDILKCGKDCYDMNIPSRIFDLSTLHKRELLKGLLRGDGGVDIKSGKYHYIKNEKHYYQHRNACGINYFSSSQKLFQQVVFILQQFGIVPTFKKREGLLYIFGYEQIKKLKDIFLGEKLRKIEHYLDHSKKIIPPKNFQKHKGFVSLEIKSIEKIQGSYVYSAEVKDTHTIVTSYGTIIHNCIPADPLYLSWKSKKLGFKTKMIDLAAYMDHYMPKYTVGRVVKLLKTKDISISKAKILILGITYKKDVKDLRESPALDVIEELKRKKAKVDYSDSLIPYLKIKSINLKSIVLSSDNLKKYDCVVIITNHSKVDYKFLRKNAKLIFDARNVYKKNYSNITRL